MWTTMKERYSKSLKNLPGQELLIPHTLLTESILSAKPKAIALSFLNAAQKGIGKVPVNLIPRSNPWSPKNRKISGFGKMSRDFAGSGMNPKRFFQFLSKTALLSKSDRKST